MSKLPPGPQVPGVTHEYANVNGIRIHYVRGGHNKARPLFLVHGLFETWLMWRRILTHLMESHYVIAVDLRGYGETDKPTELEKMTKASQATDFYALAQHLGLGRFVLIGHDRGARACRRYALDYPETLYGLALLDILPTEYIYQELTAGEAASHHWDQLFHCASGIPEAILRHCLLCIKGNSIVGCLLKKHSTMFTRQRSPHNVPLASEKILIYCS